MSSLPSVSSVSNPESWPAAFEASLASLEREITSPGDDASQELATDEDRHAELQCEQQQDESACRRCQQPTEGANILGVDVPICPACLADFVERESRPKLPVLQPITAEVRLPDMRLWSPYAR